MRYYSGMHKANTNDIYGNAVTSVLLYTLVVLPVLAVIAALAYVLFFQPVPTLEATYHDLPASAPVDVDLPWPDEGVAAVGASGYDVLARSDKADEPVPIASIAKLFTALAILEQKPLAEGEQGETISFTQVDEQRYVDTIAEQGSAYPINAGDQLTQYEALQALLIPSANNMADSLVDWAFGSEQAYLTYVNNMTDEMGLEHTKIADASGMSSESVSTPDELIATAERVLDDPVLASIVRKPRVEIDPAVGPIHNTNQLLQEQYVIGVKTGTTEEAGANLVFAAEYPLTEEVSETVIAVTLGVPDRQSNTAASREILQAAYQGFGFIEVVEADTAVGQYEVPWGEDVEIVSHGGITASGWLGQSYQATAEADSVEPTVAINEEVGLLSVTTGERTTSVPVSTAGAIAEPSFWWRLTNIF